VVAFPELPPAVAGALRNRKCRAPQPSAGGEPRNVIRGQFFTKGEGGWAVLCSVNNSTALLAFRNDRDTNPDTVITSDDRNYLQGSTATTFATHERSPRPVATSSFATTAPTMVLSRR
jgi:hypothetical protein